MTQRFIERGVSETPSLASRYPYGHPSSTYVDDIHGGVVRAGLFAVTLILCTLSARAAITGTVVNDEGRPAAASVSAFGIETSDEWRERLLSNEARKPLGTTHTDAKGNFSIEVNAPVADLRIEVTGQPPLTERAAANDDVGVLQIGAVPMKQGTITANGRAVAGATVIVAVAGGVDGVTTTDATGHYWLPDPKHLPSRVIVRHPDYADVDLELASFLTTNINVALTPGIVLSGRVVAEDGQTAVANAIIQLDNLPVVSTATDGSFSIAHAPAKTEKVIARAGNRIAAQRFRNDKPLIIRLGPSATISGNVIDQTRGLPIAGVQVNATTGPFGRSDAGASAVTDAKGNFTITSTGGQYELTARHPGYAIPILAAGVPAGGKVQRVLYAAALGRISGSVIDEDQRGLAGVRVDARRTGASDRPMRLSVMRAGWAVTAPDGRFLLRTEDAGDLQLHAAKKGFPAAHSGTLRVVSGERKAGVTITIPRGVEFSGRVADRDGKTIAGVSVTAAESGAAAEARRMALNSLVRGNDDVVRTAGDGTFSIRVKEGTYDVSFNAVTYAAKTIRAQKVSSGSKPVEVTLEPGVEIGGRVTRGGAPVEGVTIFTIGGDGGSPAQTGPDGTFRITDLAPGPMMLAFNKIGDFIRMTRAVTAPADDVNIDLPTGGRVTGRVIDKASGDTVTSFEAGISVSRGGTAMTSPPEMHPFSSDDGVFVLDGVPSGSQTLSVSAAGYVTARVRNVNVENGKTSEPVDVALESGVRVTGRVTSPDAGPVAGALVRIVPGARGARGGALDDQYTLTDPGGEYSLENVEPGETTLAFSRSGFLAVQKTVTVTGASSRVDAQLAAGASITGVVVTEGGAGVADAQVRASSAAEAGFSKPAGTDVSGSFVIDGVAPGHYEIQAVKSGYANAILRDVDITTSGALRLILKSGGVITGRVTGLTSVELQHSSVTAFAADGSASARVDSSGNYRIEGTPTGTVRVSAGAGQLANSSRNAPVKSVHVEAGETVSADFDFTDDITVSGRVTRGGEAMAGAMVSFSPRVQGERYARTSADGKGHYEITGIDKGSYTVTVNDPRLGTYSTSFDVSGSTTFDVDISGATVTGRVIDASTGAAIANASVVLTSKNANAMPARSAVSGPNGSFAFDQLSPGVYDVTGQKPGYGAATVPAAIGDSAPPALEVALTPSPGLTLRVVDARDHRPLSAWVHAVSGDGVVVNDFVSAVAAGADPAPVLLAVGTYRVTVGTSAYASQSFTINAPGEQTVGLTPGGTILISSTSDAFANVRLLDAAGQPYRSGPGPVAGIYRIDPAPGQTPIANVAAGTYTLQIVDDGNRVMRSAQVTVREGEIVPVRL